MSGLIQQLLVGSTGVRGSGPVTLPTQNLLGRYLDDGEGYDSQLVNGEPVLKNLHNPGSLPIQLEVPCLTGDGVNDYVNLSSAVGDWSSEDYAIEFWINADDATDEDVFGSNPLVSGGPYIRLIGGLVRFHHYHDSGVTVATSTTSIQTGQWYLLKMEVSGGELIVSVNGIVEDSRPLSGSLSTPSNQAFVFNINAFGADRFGGSISEIRISNTGVTKTFPFKEGAGADVYWYGSDGTYGKITNAIQGADVSKGAGAWANRTTKVKDHCVEYGGRIGASGEFILGIPNSDLAADGNPKTIQPVKSSPNAWIHRDPYNSAELSGLSLGAAIDPATDVQTIIPVDSQYERVGGSGEKDRVLIYGDTLTGSDKLNAEGYTS